jgi:hypothetical protein
MSWRAVGCAVVLGLALPATAAERHTGEVAVKGGTPVPLTVTIEELTSDDRTFELAELLHAKGDAALAEALAKLEAGEIEVGGARHRVAVARSRETDEGRVVVAITARPLSLEGAARDAKVADYALGCVELLLDADGTGQGRLTPACQMAFGEDGYLEAKNVGEEPLAIVNVR